MNEPNYSTHTVGQAIPDLALSGLNGGAINLRDFLGKKYILFMWASW